MYVVRRGGGNLARTHTTAAVLSRSQTACATSSRHDRPRTSGEGSVRAHSAIVPHRGLVLAYMYRADQEGSLPYLQLSARLLHAPGLCRHYHFQRVLPARSDPRLARIRPPAGPFLTRPRRSNLWVFQQLLLQALLFYPWSYHCPTPCEQNQVEQTCRPPQVTDHGNDDALSGANRELLPIAAKSLQKHGNLEQSLKRTHLKALPATTAAYGSGNVSQRVHCCCGGSGE